MTELAAAASNNASDVYTGVLAFLVVAALGVVCVFLFLSMNKQFRKLGPGPDKNDPAN
jgi:amino acid permease